MWNSDGDFYHGDGDFYSDHGHGQTLASPATPTLPSTDSGQSDCKVESTAVVSATCTTTQDLDGQRDGHDTAHASQPMPTTTQDLDGQRDGHDPAHVSQPMPTMNDYTPEWILVTNVVEMVESQTR